MQFKLQQTPNCNRQAARRGRCRHPRPPPLSRTCTRSVRAAAGQLDTRREGAVARVEQHSVGTAKVPKQHVEVAVAVHVRRCDRVRGRAAAGQLDTRREGAVARVEQHSVGTAKVPKQHVEVAVAVHRLCYSAPLTTPLLHRRWCCRPERADSALHERVLLGAILSLWCQHQRDPGL